MFADLPQDVKEVLEGILSKNPSDLNPQQIAFLRARSDYLNDEQKRIFQEVLNPDFVPETPSEQSVGHAQDMVNNEALAPDLKPAGTQFTDPQTNQVIPPAAETPSTTPEQIPTSEAPTGEQTEVQSQPATDEGAEFAGNSSDPDNPEQK